MAVRSKEEILGLVRTRIGEGATDDDLALIEDITDTIDNYETTSKDTTDWKKKYEDNDASWRKKYRDRFFSGKGSDEDDDKDDPKPKPKVRTFEDLFKEG